MSVQLSREEQETHIWFNKASNEATIFTYDYQWAKQLAKLASEHPEVKLVKEQFINDYKVRGVTYTLPKKFVPKPRATRNRSYSDEEKQRIVERLKNANKKR